MSNRKLNRVIDEVEMRRKTEVYPRLEKLVYYMWRLYNPDSYCDGEDMDKLKRMRGEVSYYKKMVGLANWEVIELPEDMGMEVDLEGMARDSLRGLLNMCPATTGRSEVVAELVEGFKRAFPESGDYADEVYRTGEETYGMLAVNLLDGAILNEDVEQRKHLVGDYFRVVKQVVGVIYEAHVKLVNGAIDCQAKMMSYGV